MLSKEVLNNMLSLFGECFAAGSMVKLEVFDGERGVLRCSREDLDKVLIALTLIREVDGKPVTPLTLGVSGTIKSCRKKYLEV